MSIAAFAGGLIVFFGLHLYSAFRPYGPDARPWGLPVGPYKGLYSLLSLAAFAALVWGYGESRPIMIVWTPPVWTRHIVMGLMPIAMVLLVAAYAPTGYIKKAVKHPMLAAVKIWAFAHLTANGDLASMILFGSFLAYAVVDRIALKRRGDRGPTKEPHIIGDMIALAVGGAAFGIVAFYLHEVLFGVPAVL